jgi:hypothetical protein
MGDTVHQTLFPTVSETVADTAELAVCLATANTQVSDRQCKALSAYSYWRPLWPPERIRPTLAGVSAAGRRDSHAAEHEVFTGGEFAAHGRHENSVAQVGGRLTATAELCSASAVSPHRRPTRPPPAASGHNRP